ncbi:uncharacterized protein [Clinocottus analis]|uniref:uncharacterized protein isoform X2 n=1 Tax=Clinocottus analis TaxID=304258 RepID=UPI0035C24E9B
MQRYRWPGYDMQLLGELQKQQNNAQFCDVLLKTEGISVPTHSCILAALSPYLCQKLSASPSPPSGQKRELWLQAVKSQTLLKLVCLLYSGEVEVKGSAEQNDLLSAACQFGISHLVEGQNNGQVGEGKPQKGLRCRERNGHRKMQETQVQAKVAGWKNTVSPTEKRSCVSTGRQSVISLQKAVSCSTTHSAQTEHPTLESEPFVAKNVDCSTSMQSHNITLDTQVSSTPCPHVSCVHSGVQSDGESAFDQSSGSVKNPTPTSSLSSNVMAFSLSVNDDSNSTTSQENGAYQQSSNIGKSIQVFAKEGRGLKDRKTYGKTAVNGENTEQRSNRDEMLGAEKGNSTEMRHAHANVGIKSLTKLRRMQQMMETETTQISIKVKLRRRTNGEVWEVVSMQNTDEALSVLTSLKQDGSCHKRLQTDLTNSEPPPSCVQPGPAHKPKTPTIEPATSNSPEPPHPNSPSDSQLLSSNCLDSGLESVPLPQPPGPVEECDEHIEKLLEDFMMGLNFLPNLDRDCTKAHYHQPNHEGAQAICPVPVTENERPLSRMHAAASTAGCEYYQDFGKPIGHTSTNTAQPAQQQRSGQCHSSVPSVGQGDGTSHEGMPLSKTQISSYPEALTGQKLTSLTYFPACQELPLQDNQNILELLPLINGNGAQSLHSLPCMDDLRLPPCLSPLADSTSPAKQQPILNSSTNQSGDIQPQSPAHGFRPWLAVNSRPLQFPLSAITHEANQSASLPHDSNRSCGSKQRKKHLKLNPQSGGTMKASCSFKEVEERGAISAGHQNGAEQKCDLGKKKKSFKCKQIVPEGDAAVPKKRKRKHKDCPQEASSPLSYKHLKVSDDTKKHSNQINLGVCLVSLSSNNVLAKEREMAAGSNMPNTFVRKKKEPSTITESQRKKTKRSGDLGSNQTRIGTRGFLKKTLATPSISSIESLLLKPVVCRDQIVKKPEGPKRGRGRPRKTKIEEIPPESSLAVKDSRSPDVKKEVQVDSVLKEDSIKRKKCRKRMRNRSKVEAAPPMALSAEANHNSDVILTERKHGEPKQPRMVSLQDFKKLIKRQHSKTKNSKESQDKKTSETSKVEESEEGKTCGSRFNEITNGSEMYIAQPTNSDGVEECRAVFNGTVDKNHYQVINKSAAEYEKSPRDKTSRSTRDETVFLGDESPPRFSFNEELAAETEKSLKNPDEACDEEVSDKPKQTEGSSPSDTHLPQQDKRPLVSNLNLQTPERTSPPLLDAVWFGRSSGCDQEEEEVEVDILLFSPDKLPLAEECENGLDNVETTSEQEEEEDVIEIDVTGD